MNGTHILKAAPMMGAIFARAQIFGGEHALHHQKVGGPVAERDHPAEPEHDAGPVDAHRIVAERAERAPHMRVVLRRESCAWMRRDHAAPAAGFDQGR